MELTGDAQQEKTINSLQKWFEDNKKLPQKIDRTLLTRFYYCMHKNIEETKKVLLTNYAIRQSNPHLFVNRDPTDEDTANTVSYADMVYLPGLTPDNARISILRIKNPDPKMMHYAKDFKAFVMVTDHRFSMPDAVKDKTPLVAEGDIQIIDMKNYTMGHLARTSFGVFRTYLKYLQQAYPVNVKALHMVNCPRYLNNILTVVKPFISKQVYERIHFHTKGLETLYAYVPREMLPEEYGGNTGTMPGLMEEAKNSLSKKKDYLTDLNYWKNQ